MSYLPLLALLLVLVVGGGVTLLILFRADRAGHFRDLAVGATVLFDEEEPIGVPQDQLYAPDTQPLATHE